MNMPNESNVSTEEQRAAWDPAVGSGTPDTAEWEEPAIGWLRREPLVAALLAANAPLVAGLLGSLAEGAPWWLSTLLGVAIAALNIAGALARKAVTPTAAPRLDKHTRLTVE